MKKVLGRVLLVVLCLAMLPAVAFAAAATPAPVMPRNASQANRLSNNVVNAMRNFDRQAQRIETLRGRQEVAYARLIARQEAAEARLIQRQQTALRRAYARFENTYRPDGRLRSAGLQARLDDAVAARTAVMTASPAAQHMPPALSTAGRYETGWSARLEAGGFTSTPSALMTIDYPRISLEDARPAVWLRPANVDVFPTLLPWRRGAGVPVNNVLNQFHPDFVSATPAPSPAPTPAP